MIPILNVCDNDNNWIEFDSNEDIGTIVFFDEEQASRALLEGV